MLGLFKRMPAMVSGYAHLAPVFCCLLSAHFSITLTRRLVNVQLWQVAAVKTPLNYSEIRPLKAIPRSAPCIVVRIGWPRLGESSTSTRLTRDRELPRAPWLRAVWSVEKRTNRFRIDQPLCRILRTYVYSS